MLWFPGNDKSFKTNKKAHSQNKKERKFITADTAHLLNKTKKSLWGCVSVCVCACMHNSMHNVCVQMCIHRKHDVPRRVTTRTHP